MNMNKPLLLRWSRGLRATDEEVLEEITKRAEHRYRERTIGVHRPKWANLDSVILLALVAEVRRLRAELAQHKAA